MIGRIARVCLLLAAGVTGWGQEAGGPRLRRVLDQVYVAAPADREAQSLDLYAPEGAVRAPVLVFVHGGAWRTGDKVGTGHRLVKAPAFVAAGWVFVSVNYRMAPAVTHPVYVQDVAAAIAWVHGHVAAYGGDPERIFLMGHSAGAHLAAAAAVDARWLGALGLPLGTVKGTVLLDGAAYHLPAQIAGARAAGGGRLYTDAFGLERAGWVDASPALQVRPDQGVGPFMIWHAGERAAARVQARLLARALQGAGYTASIHEAPDDDHASLNRELGQAGDAETASIMQWLQAQAAQGSAGAAARRD